MSSQTCPNCGWLNRASNRFCSNCGGAIVPSTPAPAPTDAVATPEEFNAALAADTPATPSSASTPSNWTLSDATSPITPIPSQPVIPQADTQPVAYAVKRWDAGASEPETSYPFAPPAMKSDPAAPAIPIAPPPVPPTSYPYTTNDGTTATYSYSAESNAAGSTVALPQRSEGGTYVPYTTEVTKHLEAKSNARPWLIPSVIVGVLLLLVVGSVGGFLVLNGNKSVAPPVSGLGSATCADLLARSKSDSNMANTEDGLKAIICQSNNEQITAWQKLDTEILKGTRTGQALDENIQAVQDLQGKEMYAIPDNKSIAFGDVTMNDTTATAKTVEVWTVTFYSKTNNKKVLSQGPDTLREVYHFVKQDGKWLISSVDIVPNASTTPGTGDT